MSSPLGEFSVVIPARYGSTRLPGKPLRLLAGRPMIAHVWERGVDAGASEVIVAADDERICAAVAAAGGRALMTSPDHTSGTDRLAEVAQRLGWPADRVVVNLQGDEPCMPGSLIRLVAGALAAHPAAGIATVATPIRDRSEVANPNVVKVVIDDDHMASYFSRAPIPWVRDDSLASEVIFLRHLGLYAYRVSTLLRVSAAEPRPNEIAESLEQLRGLALGVGIHVSIVEQAPGHGVDTEEDLARVERELA